MCQLRNGWSDATLAFLAEVSRASLAAPRYPGGVDLSLAFARFLHIFAPSCAVVLKCRVTPVCVA